MKTVRLLYPYDSVINLLQKLLKLKGYEVLLLDEKEGLVEAILKRRFRKDLLLNVKISKVDHNLTHLELSLSALSAKGIKEPISAASNEEKILESIDNYF